MKHLALNILLLLAIATGVQAQDKTPVQKADFANWVIESNLKTPRNSIIKFYNAKQEIIYQEEIKDKRLNVTKTKVRAKLNQVLAQLTEKNDKIIQCNLVAVSLKAN